MNYQDKTKDELIKELRKKQQEYDLLKTSYEKDIRKCKLTEETLAQQNVALSKLKDFSIGLSKLSFEENIEKFITRQLKEITGAGVAVFAEYNQTNRTLTAKHIEIEPGLLGKVIGILGQQINRIHIVVSDEMYHELSLEIIRIRKTLSEATFGAISRPAGAAIQALLKADRFIGLAYLNEGKLYGTSLLVRRMDQPDPPREILENFIYLVSQSLRRKQTEELLKESMKRLDEAQKLAHIGVWDWISDTDTVIWTDELYRIAGLDPMLPAPTYKEHSNLYTPESWELLKTGVEKAMETGEPYQFELELIRPDGETRDVNAFGGAKYDSKGQVNGLFGTVQDITKHKKVIASLVESEAKFRSLFENSLVGISITSPNGGLLQANLAYARMYGYENPETMLADVKNVGRLYVNPDDRREVLQILSKNGFMESKEFEVFRRDGSRFFVLVSACEIRNDEGELLYNQAIHMDLTGQKKADEELRKSKELLEKLNTHLHDIRENEREVISRDIHDQLGQSLTALKIDLSWLSGKISVDSEEGTKLKKLIELVNNTSKDVHRISSELRPVILDDLGLASALEWYCEEFANRTGLKVQIEIEDVQTENMKKNLAIYRVAQESLTNIVRHADAKKVQIKLRKIKKDIVLLIRDDGIGVSPDVIRSSKSLGLLGMFERVNQCGGHMEITTPIKGGTRIRIYIPIG